MTPGPDHQLPDRGCFVYTYGRSHECEAMALELRPQWRSLVPLLRLAVPRCFRGKTFVAEV